MNSTEEVKPFSNLDKIKMLEVILSWSMDHGYNDLARKTSRNLELLRQNTRVGESMTASFRGRPVEIKGTKNEFHPHHPHLSNYKRNQILDQLHKVLNTMRHITSECPRCSRMLHEYFEGEQQREFVAEQFLKELNVEGI